MSEALDIRPDSPAGAASAGGATGPACLPVYEARRFDPEDDAMLRLNAPLAAGWLERFLQAELRVRRGFRRAIVGLSGGVDSALTACLCARALGAENVIAVRMPYRTNSPRSLEHAQFVIDDLGIRADTIDITPAADGYLATQPDADPRRRGNVFARQRMIVLFDLSARYDALPVGTGNKTERLFGYFTWHADDSPPINPLGDLFKTQVWQLARYVGVPEAIVSKPASADLIAGQTDEGDFGISYARADRILHYLLLGYPDAWLMEKGFPPADVRLVRGKLESTHWKRHLPTFAMLSATSINDYYLRPVDY